MTEPTPQAESKRKVKPDSIEQLQRLVESMTEEERDNLERAGVVIPTGSLSAVRDDVFKWGVRCTHCNKIALYLIGERWNVDGEVTEQPPPLHHSRLMWTQKLPPAEIDRGHPRCQHCGVPVALNKDGSFARERGRFVLVADFEQSRDRAYQMGRTQAKKLEQGSAAVQQDVGDLSHDYSTPKEPVSAVIARQRGGDQSLAEIEYVAAQSGANQFSPKR